MKVRITAGQIEATVLSPESDDNAVSDVPADAQRSCCGPFRLLPKTQARVQLLPGGIIDLEQDSSTWTRTITPPQAGYWPYICQTAEGKRHWLSHDKALRIRDNHRQLGFTALLLGNFTQRTWAGNGRFNRIECRNR